jgi:endonuclease/exonuclease/phosphatase family metal-dependent hydrolase
MRCLTLNIWNYHRPWSTRRRLIADLIITHRPDVVLLQETRHDFRHEGGKGQDVQIAELTGYHSMWAAGQVYWRWPRVDEGLTILTHGAPRRTMVRRLTRFRQRRGDGNQRLCLGAVLDLDGREVHVYTSHFSLNEQVRVQNAIEVYRFVRAQSGSIPAILTGDLNGVPGEMAIRFLVGQETVDNERGDFVDCWAAANPAARGHTWAPWEPIRRIDYVLGRNLPSLPAEARLVGTEARDGVYPSDHVGILVDFPF